MKRLLLVSALGISLLCGCPGPIQRTSFNTIYSLESGVTKAYSGYVDLVIKGSVSTNSLPKIKKAFNDFQASELVALDAVQFNTNALAPAALVTEGQDVINLISTAK